MLKLKTRLLILELIESISLGETHVTWWYIFFMQNDIMHLKQPVFYPYSRYEISACIQLRIRAGPMHGRAHAVSVILADVNHW